MQHKYYAKALLELIVQEPENYKQHLAALQDLLKRKGKEKLLPKISKELLKLLEKHSRRLPKVIIAKDKDLQKAKEKAEALGAKDANVFKNPNIVGGYIIKTRNFVYDASYRKYLLDLYNKLKS